MASELLILGGETIRGLLAPERAAVVDAVRRAYLAWGAGQATPPDSTFLRFPGRERERIIALPAWLGAEWQLAGIKWIASFPENTRRGLDRASATLILNDTETGHPIAVLESSIISAWRTAASAALAACRIHPGPPARLGVVGAGLIAWETLLFLDALLPGAQELLVADLDPAASAAFARRAEAGIPGLRARPASTEDALAAEVAVLATTAIHPHIHALPPVEGPRTLLHISLRDLAPELLLRADNTADDVGHVNQARTSVHLLSQQLGHADFLRAGMASLLTAAPGRAEGKDLAIFHPFGLGLLDLAVGALVLDLARARGAGVRVPDFLPRPWRSS